MSKIDIKNKIFLAPMAGYTDQAFRIISFRNNVDIAYSEMVSAKAMKYKDKKTFDLLKVGREETEVGIQLFGSEKDILGQATKVLDQNPSVNIIDLNIGCPAPKIFKNGDGSALLSNPKKIYEILSEMRKATNKNLSAKMRIGISEKNNYIEVARAIEEAGVDFLIVHGRTRDQFYTGEADWEAIGTIKSKLKIPIVGNGDINMETNITRLIEDYKVDGLMVGRGCVGNPWIFQKIKMDLVGKNYTYPTEEEKFKLIFDHIDLAVELKGEKIAIPEMRKHLHAYLKGLRGSAKLKNDINNVKSKLELEGILSRYLEEILTYAQ